MQGPRCQMVQLWRHCSDSGMGKCGCSVPALKHLHHTCLVFFGFSNWIGLPQSDFSRQSLACQVLTEDELMDCSFRWVGLASGFSWPYHKTFCSLCWCMSKVFGTLQGEMSTDGRSMNAKCKGNCKFGSKRLPEGTSSLMDSFWLCFQTTSSKTTATELLSVSNTLLSDFWNFCILQELSISTILTDYLNKEIW